MPRNRLFIVLRLALVPVCLAASGCFVPNGGWTMRTGVDLRRMWKPSVFVEMVDTKWDEYNRVEELNTSCGYAHQGVVFEPSSPPIETAPIPASMPTSSSQRNGSAANGLVPPPSQPASREPNMLPGTTVDATDGPQTVQQSTPGGPQLPDATGTSSGGAASAVKEPRRPLASRLFPRP